MGLFNLLETFFIISLAIMFILVGLLMYHIRTRLNASEQRIDAAYEIITNLSDKINAQNVHIANIQYTGAAATSFIPFQPESIGNSSFGGVKKIVVSENDDDNEDEDDNENEDDNEHENDYEENNEIENSEYDETDTELDDVDDVDDVEEGNDSDEVGNISEIENEIIINEHSFDHVHVIKLQSEKSENTNSDNECVTAVIDDSVSVMDLENLHINTENEYPPVVLVAEDTMKQTELNEIYTEEIHLDVVNSTVEDDKSVESNTISDIPEISLENTIEYNKLGLSKLKKLAETRGLTDTYDISRMKKSELISILQL